MISHIFHGHHHHQHNHSPMHAARIHTLMRRLYRTPVTASTNVWISSPYSGRVFAAEPEEIGRICDDYKAIADKYSLFERMFIQLFIEEEVELSVHFGLENLNETELRADQRFRTHVGKFQRFMTALLDMLSKGPERSAEIVEVLRIVGRQHGNVRSMSFTAEKWLIFKNVLLSLLCASSNDKSYSTWSKLVSFVIYEIKDSYLEHVRHARSTSCPHIIAARVMRMEVRNNSEEKCPL